MNEAMLDTAQVRRWKRYEHFVPIRHRWLSKLPSHWEKKRLSFVFDTLGSGTTPNTSERRYYDDGKIPWVNTGDLIDGLITEVQKYVNETAIREHSALKLYPAGTLLVALYGATIGKVGLIAKPSTVNQACFAMGNANGVDSRFVLYWFIGSRDHLLSMAYGGGQPNISGELIRSLRLPVPPLSEQRTIAAFLDREMARIDALVAKKQLLIELLEEKRQAVISHAVTKGLGPNVELRESTLFWLDKVPQDWPMTRLKFVADVQTGLTLGKNYEDRELIERPYLRVANVQDGYLDLADITRIRVPADDVSRHELQSGDVLMTEGGDFDKLGRGFVWEGQIEGCLHQNHVFAVRPRQNLLLPRYLAALMTSFHGKTYFTFTSQQSTNLASTNSTKLGNFPIPIPTVAQQGKILNVIAERTGKINSCVQRIRDGIARLLEYRTALISAAVTGQIDVRGEVQLDD